MMHPHFPRDVSDVTSDMMWPSMWHDVTPGPQGSPPLLYLAFVEFRFFLEAQDNFEHWERGRWRGKDKHEEREREREKQKEESMRTVTRLCLPMWALSSLRISPRLSYSHALEVKNYFISQIPRSWNGRFIETNLWGRKICRTYGCSKVIPIICDLISVSWQSRVSFRTWFPMSSEIIVNLEPTDSAWFLAEDRQVCQKQHGPTIQHLLPGDYILSKHV